MNPVLYLAPLLNKGGPAPRRTPPSKSKVFWITLGCLALAGVTTWFFVEHPSIGIVQAKRPMGRP